MLVLTGIFLFNSAKLLYFIVDELEKAEVIAPIFYKLLYIFRYIYIYISFDHS